MTYKYLVVRSYANGSKTGMDDLISAFNNGFEFVRASEVVNNSKGCFDYIEYILRRKAHDDQTT